MMPPHCHKNCPSAPKTFPLWTRVRCVLLILLFALASPGFAQTSSGSYGGAEAGESFQQTYERSRGQVRFNWTVLNPRTLQALQQHLRVAIPAGDYWYDPTSGAVGRMGGPALGFTTPALRFCGPLPAAASGGHTSVFVNGRALHPVDLRGLAALLGPIAPGRYWLDARGNYGVEGYSASGNLVAIAQARATGRTDQGTGTYYKDFGGRNGRTHLGHFGGGDFYFSSGGTSWWPGK